MKDLSKHRLLQINNASCFTDVYLIYYMHKTYVGIVSSLCFLSTVFLIYCVLCYSHVVLVNTVVETSSCFPYWLHIISIRMTGQSLWKYTRCYDLRLGSDCNLGKDLSKRVGMSQLVKHKDIGQYLLLYIPIDNEDNVW